MKTESTSHIRPYCFKNKKLLTCTIAVIRLLIFGFASSTLFFSCSQPKLEDSPHWEKIAAFEKKMINAKDGHGGTEPFSEKALEKNLRDYAYYINSLSSSKYTIPLAVFSNLENHLATYHRAHPKNGEMLAWKGSLTTQKANSVSKITKKMEYVKEGFALLDQALAEYPDNRQVLIIHGVNSASVPRMFKREEYALSDFQTLLKYNGEKWNLTTNELALARYYMAKSLHLNKKTEPARKYAKQVILKHADTEYAVKAKTLLEKLPGENK